MRPSRVSSDVPIASGFNRGQEDEELTSAVGTTDVCRAYGTDISPNDLGPPAKKPGAPAAGAARTALLGQALLSPRAFLSKAGERRGVLVRQNLHRSAGSRLAPFL